MLEAVVLLYLLLYAVGRIAVPTAVGPSITAVPTAAAGSILLLYAVGRITVPTAEGRSITVPIGVGRSITVPTASCCRQCYYCTYCCRP